MCTFFVTSLCEDRRGALDRIAQIRSIHEETGREEKEEASEGLKEGYERMEGRKKRREQRRKRQSKGQKTERRRLTGEISRSLTILSPCPSPLYRCYDRLQSLLPQWLTRVPVCPLLSERSKGG
jgi:hypothetical protein